jgi:hypothetical protein
MKNKQIVAALVFLALLICIFLLYRENVKSPSLVPNDKAVELDTFNPQYSGNLVDVSGGEASGFVQVDNIEGDYQLVSVFENLPELEDGYFYEGWIVRRGENMSVISTGKVEAPDGMYINLFNSTEDLRDHDFYVLTLEPDDGDPAPAEHVIEGEILSVN